MKKIALLIVALCTAIGMEAQMNTDNSYLRENYNNSKTAKRAAEKKAARKARKEAEKQQKAQKEKATYYVKAKDGSVTTKEKAAQKAADMDAPYLEGAVPVNADGIVCFERTFPTQGKSSQQVYDIMKETAQDIINGPMSVQQISRILSDEPNEIVATICEPLYFKKKKWEVDSTLIRYQYLASIDKDKATLRIWLINYCYESPTFDFKAEQWITDKYALTKDKKALMKGSGKFRRKTVDYVNELFGRVEERLNIEH